jgi:CMD domain protein
MTESPTEPDDLVEDILGIAPGSRLAALRRRRPEALRHSQGAHEELLRPADPGGVSHAERAALALRVALREGEGALADRYRALLGRAGAPAALARAAEDLSGDGAAAGGERLAALLRHADLVASRPGDCGQADIDRLSALGLSPRDIVAVTQLVAFVPYQVRLLAGLRAMQGEDGA